MRLAVKRGFLMSTERFFLYKIGLFIILGIVLGACCMAQQKNESKTAKQKPRQDTVLDAVIKNDANLLDKILRNIRDDKELSTNAKVAQLHMFDDNLNTPLHHAIANYIDWKKRKVNIEKLFNAHDVDEANKINILNRHLESWYQVEQARKIIRRLMQNNLVNVLAYNGAFHTSLDFALSETKLDDPELILFLINLIKLRISSFDINKQYPTGHTILSAAVAKGFAGIIKLLITQLQADPTIRTADGETPLFVAIKAGSIKAVKALLQNASSRQKKELHEMRNAMNLTAREYTIAKAYEAQQMGNLKEQDVYNRILLLLIS